MKESTVAPLKVWILLCFIIISFQVFVFFYIRNNVANKQNKIARIYSIESALSHLSKAQEEQIKVVIIGSSLVGHGIDCQDNIVKQWGTEKNTPIHITKIWLSGDPFRELLENENLIEKLIRIKPDLICIQTELLAINFGETRKFKNPLLSVSLYNKLLIYSVLNKTDLNFIKTYSGIQCLPEGKKIKIDTLNFQPAIRRLKKKDEISFAFNELKKLQLAGIKTVILDLPRPSKAEEKIFEKQFLSQHQELLNMYKNDFGMEYWKYTGKKMFFSDFVDGGHLSQNGKEDYTKWLQDKILKEIPN